MRVIADEGPETLSVNEGKYNPPEIETVLNAPNLIGILSIGEVK